MKYGVCCPAGQAAWAREAGCDYVELNFTAVAEADAAAFAAIERDLALGGLRAEAMNCFLPGRFALMALTDTQELQAFLRIGFTRAQALGTQVVVFGSAGARKLPEGVTKEQGIARLAPLLRLAGDIAASCGVRIAIEPLCYKECNAVNTLREGLALASVTGHSAVALLADMFHMGENGEKYEDILLAGERLIHCHIGRPGGRVYPLPGDGYDYAPFFAALAKNAYQGRLSVEAQAPNGPEDLATSITFLRSLTQNI
ncbi:MAG: sugar phosphate isomerase/epimerase [Oscillospiraceae bacterium]|jgi:sugar phosphate isomerase/epimerase|nr:sugar phosphate isomerase/epimerase [Oscillospiraceae bacterium]